MSGDLSMLERAQIHVLTKLREENDKLKRDNQVMMKKLERYAGIIIGAVHQYGDRKRGQLRLTKKTMTAVRPAFVIDAGIDSSTKDLVVVLNAIPDSNVKGVRNANPHVPKEIAEMMGRPHGPAEEPCQSTTTSAENADESTNSTTQESTTNQKSASSAEESPTKS